MTTTEFAVPGRMPQQLINYWVHGKGAAKIRWGTPGDFDRCVRNLAKYFPRNPQGLCNRLHTRALGQPPGQGHALDPGEEFAAELDALADDLLYEDELAMVPVKPYWRGTLAPIGVPTGDRRRFASGSISHRDLPLPLLWQKQTGDGHSQSVVVGRILGIDIDDDGVYGYGDWLETEDAYEAQRLVEAGVLHPSVDLDNIDFELRLPDSDTPFDPGEHCDAKTGECEKHEFVVTQGRVSATTLVAIPAFAEAKLEVYEGADEEGLLAAFDELPLIDEDALTRPCGCGMTAAAIQAYIAPAITASAGLVPSDEFRAPRAWFERPRLRPEPGWYYTAEGRVFGRLGGEGICHLGLADCKTIPHSTTGYAWFHQSWAYTDEGERIRVGKLFYGGKHANLRMGLTRAIQHYDDTSRAFAVVRIYDDEHGPVVAGSLLPGIDAETLAQALASPLSGDWRMVGTGLELVAALAVNVPGFPVVGATDEDRRPLALVASAGVPAILVVDDTEIFLRDPEPTADPDEAAAALAMWTEADTAAKAARLEELAGAFG